MTLYRVGNVDADAETHTVFLLDRIATALERIAAHFNHTSSAAATYHANAVAAALDVATDTDDPDADALLEAAQDAIAKRLQEVTK